MAGAGMSSEEAAGPRSPGRDLAPQVEAAAMARWGPSSFWAGRPLRRQRPGACVGSGRGDPEAGLRGLSCCEGQRRRSSAPGSPPGGALLPPPFLGSAGLASSYGDRWASCRPALGCGRLLGLETPRTELSVGKSDRGAQPGSRLPTPSLSLLSS